MTYAVMSDLHCHDWNLFSHVEKDGVNNRLRHIHNEMKRAAAELKKAGGKYMVIAGDIFHVRGKLDPEVLNSTQSVIREILDSGVSILTIPGNHDLKGKDTTQLGSAIQTLSETFSENGSFTIFNDVKLFTTEEGEHFGFVPWCSSNEDLLQKLSSLAASIGNAVDQVDVFIHAGIDGVLAGLDGHGIDVKELQKFGFRNIYAGHYHNHKLVATGVFSIGAATHQTWSDVGSKAGFLLVDNSTSVRGAVRFMDSHAPKFIDVSGRDENEIKLLCDGNYVRYRGGQMTTDDIKELKKFFDQHGALGTSIQVPPAQTSQRQGVTPAKSGQTLGQSVDGYVSTVELAPHIDRNEVKRQAADVLKAAQSVYEEA